MPEKHNPYATPGMKVLGLYYKLLFSRKKYSLSELAQSLGCSKQTILRYLDQIRLGQRVRIETWTENRQKYCRAVPPQQLHNVTLGVSDIENLMLCRDLVWHLIPEGLREDISKAIGHASMLLPADEILDSIPEKSAQTLPKGFIDYGERQGIFETVKSAMSEHRVLRIDYLKPGQEKAATHFMAPFRFLVSGECIYVLGWYLWEKAVPPELYKMTLALHRIQSAVPTDRTFAKEDPAEVPPQSFGIIEGEPFKVRVKFRPDAAVFVRERVWSKDQTVEALPDGGIVLTFTSTSEPEVHSWVLSFGSQAELMEPDTLRRQIADDVGELALVYSGKPQTTGCA